MTVEQVPGSYEEYRDRIADLVQAALVVEGRDVAELVAYALVEVARREGGSEEVLRNRSGSWEAGLVRQLIEGTAGPDLPAYKVEGEEL